DTADGHVLHDERCARDHLTLVGICDLTLPGNLAGILVGRDQAAIEGMRNDEIAPQRHAAIVDAAAGHRAGPVVVRLRVHLPEQHAFAAVSVDLVNRAPSVGDIHEAVFDDRRAFETAMRPDAAALDATELHGPGDLEVLHIILVDVGERGEARRGII